MIYESKQKEMATSPSIIYEYFDQLLYKNG